MTMERLMEKIRFELAIFLIRLGAKVFNPKSSITVTHKKAKKVKPFVEEFY